MQPDPPGKEKENLKRALKVINEGDDTDEDDVPQGPHFPDEDGGDVIVRKVKKAERALKVSVIWKLGFMMSLGQMGSCKPPKFGINQQTCTALPASEILRQLCLVGICI
jgi:hypothetical protein